MIGKHFTLKNCSSCSFQFPNTQCCQKKRLMQHSGKHAPVLTEYAHMHLYVSVYVYMSIYNIRNFLLIPTFWKIRFYLFIFWHFLVKMKNIFKNKNNNKPLWWSRKADIQIERSRQCETLQYWNLYCFHRFSCFLIAKDCYPKEKPTRSPLNISTLRHTVWQSICLLVQTYNTCHSGY